MSDLFLTTHWTRVLAARGETSEARQALSDLCEAYYVPVLSFLRQSGRDDDTAREIAHDFFASVLERHGLRGADPSLGRFRTYLLGAVKHFLAKRHASNMRLKRGAKAPHESLAPGTDTSPGLDVPDPATLPPDAAFDREWAVNVLDRSLRSLARESEESGSLAQFEALKPWLTGIRPDLSQAQAARMLGISEGAVRVAVHRLRRRFRELVKSEIAQTVDGPKAVEEELKHLITVLS
ncbi:MAG: RNA polymerase sigma factor [Verrucomicrobiia bacterium]